MALFNFLFLFYNILWTAEGSYIFPNGYSHEGKCNSLNSGPKELYIPPASQYYMQYAV